MAAVDRGLAERGAGAAEKPALDLNAVAQRIVDALDRNETPAALDWRHAPWCLWRTVPALVAHASARQMLLAQAARPDRRAVYRRLASSFLIDYAPGRDAMEEVGATLAGQAAATGEPWASLQDAYRIFAPGGVRRLAEGALTQGCTVPELLSRHGLGAVASSAGLAEAAYQAGLTVLAERPVRSAAERLDTVKTWCLNPRGEVIYHAYRAEMVNALVLPYRDTMPSKGDQSLLLNFLTARFGDPRIRAGSWIGMEAAAGIVKRWLTEVALRQFFDVVDTIAPEGMWRYRRAFWSAYHQRDLILNAWVVFGEDGAREARRAFGQNIAFGRFIKGGGKPVLPGHAVLLIDLGRCIVADWSHTGYCNIWPADDPSRPRHLNAQTYSTDDVRRTVPHDRSERSLTAHDIFSHAGSDNYVWQHRVAARISALTGQRLSQSAFAVEFG
ncbi:EH signature domain-containing protein [Methylorubrum extorquens]